MLIHRLHLTYLCPANMGENHSSARLEFPTPSHLQEICYFTRIQQWGWVSLNGFQLPGISIMAQFQDYFQNVHWYKPNLLKQDAFKEFDRAFLGIYVMAAKTPTPNLSNKIPDLRATLSITIHDLRVIGNKTTGKASVVSKRQIRHCCWRSSWRQIMWATGASYSGANNDRPKHADHTHTHLSYQWRGHWQFT